VGRFDQRDELTPEGPDGSDGRRHEVAFRVLAIDGGGIRGLVPATVLHELEELTRRPTNELFDLVVGTSTGALLAFGLTVPDPEGRARYRAQDLVAFYVDDGPRIFSRPLWHRLRTVNGLTGPRLPATGLEEALERTFDDARLADVLGDVLVTTYETEGRQPFLLRSRRARNDAAYDFALADAARAATAAPTYFAPALLTGGDGVTWSVIDGGVYANNPTMVGIVEAFARYGTRDVVTVSLGTGAMTRPLPHRTIRHWGLARWARPAYEIVIDGVTSTVDFQAAELARSTGQVGDHVRFDVELVAGRDDIDEASPANIAAIRALADAMVVDRADDLARLAEVLTSED
jgi:uncharacterized protein